MMPSSSTNHVLARSLSIWLLFGIGNLAFAGQTPVDNSIEEQEATQREAVTSQQHINELDDETRIALEQYRETMRRVDQLLTYNDQMERMVESQNGEIGELEGQIDQIEITQRRILPLMRQMLDVVEDLVAADAPFLLEEREARIRELNQMMQDANTPLADKFRRLLEAYQIEMEYGNTIEAYRAELPRTESEKTVELLRIGRTALYYVTLNEQEAGVWDVRNRSWQTLPDGNIALIKQGMRLARKELPPDLVRLPIPAPEQES